MAESARPFLVVSSVGPDSRHPQWLQGRRGFDLALIDYAGGCPESPDYRLWRRKGAKWPNLAYLSEVWPHLRGYAAVAVLDDDLQLDGVALDRAFELFEQHGLWLAQPSLRLDSAFSWTFTLQRPYLALRFTGFVENGLTLLRGQDIAPLTEVFAQAQSGYGLDWILPRLLKVPARKVAVLDEVCAFHPPRHPALDQHWSRAEQERHGLELCRRYGVKPLDPSEEGFVLNARGRAWEAQGTPAEVIYATAHRFVLHQMTSVIQKFRPRSGLESCPPF